MVDAFYHFQKLDTMDLTGAECSRAARLMLKLPERGRISAEKQAEYNKLIKDIADGTVRTNIYRCTTTELVSNANVFLDNRYRCQTTS